MATGRDSQVIIDSSTKDSQKITSQSTAIFCQALTKTISSFKIFSVGISCQELFFLTNAVCGFKSISLEIASEVLFLAKSSKSFHKSISEIITTEASK